MAGCDTNSQVLPAGLRRLLSIVQSRTSRRARLNPKGKRICLQGARWTCWGVTFKRVEIERMGYVPHDVPSYLVLSKETVSVRHDG